ncbi:MAG TPA: hypothetical protein DEO59_01025 [Balneola sp.]|nr:hypothetical protein [Balneola sp.]
MKNQLSLFLLLSFSLIFFSNCYEQNELKKFELSLINETTSKVDVFIEKQKANSPNIREGAFLDKNTGEFTSELTAQRDTTRTIKSGNLLVFRVAETANTDSLHNLDFLFDHYLNSNRSYVTVTEDGYLEFKILIESAIKIEPGHELGQVCDPRYENCNG